ncbi:MAG: alanine--tRNA ligase-related protein, partial [Actinomycetes bacterium]
PALAATVAEVMAAAYPELTRDLEFISGVVAREEERFGQTLQTGSAILEEELARGRAIPGEVAFRLHDTYGFPIDLTREVAAEAGVDVDLAGFESAMADQRARARAAGLGGGEASEHLPRYRELYEEMGPTEFVGYETCSATARVLAVVDLGEAPADKASGATAGAPAGAPVAGAGPAGRRVEVFLDRTPFYAEGGGQVGDTGSITTATGQVQVVDTTSALPGLTRHYAEVVQGELQPGQEARAEVDAERRSAVRRNHTATHLVHWALREILGAHVRQQGSLVAPDRLRFDFSHFSPVGPEEIEAVEDLVNAAVLADRAVSTEETSREEADRAGAIAFFGDRYGERVRVVHAGPQSVELCGGTHVDALGMIGPFKIVSEGSIGSNTRRIEALTGTSSLAHARAGDHLLRRVAEMVRAATPDEVPGRVERLQAQARSAADEVRATRAATARREAAELAGQAT